MTKKNKIIMFSAIGAAVLLGVVLLVVFLSKKEDEGTKNAPTAAVDQGEDKVTYTLELKNGAGQPIDGVGVYAYTDATKSELITFARTDESGEITFSEKKGITYVVFLTGVPEGYTAEESYEVTEEHKTIVLEGEAMVADDGRYELGEELPDMTFTDVNGVEYNVADLLSTKKAVVLNFWFTSCDPCKAEFPYLQQAYSEYSDDIIVLALNPVDTKAEDVKAFAETMGLTFPVAICDASNEQAFGITGYPTTIVIDRNGVISMVHKGSIPDAQVFRNVFAYFCAEEYDGTAVTDVTTLPEAESTLGTQNNPMTVIASQTTTVTIEPGTTMYFQGFKIVGMLLDVTGTDGIVVYEGEEYSMESGTAVVPMVTGDTFTPTLFAVRNDGTQSQTYELKFTFEEGSAGNPLPFTIGEFKSYVAKGNEEGVFYTYKATKPGTLMVTCIGADSDVEFDYVLYNLTSYAYRTFSEDGKVDASGRGTLEITVRAGDEVQFSVTALPEDKEAFQGATYTFVSAFAETTTEQDGNGEAGGTQDGGTQGGGTQDGGTGSGEGTTEGDKEVTYTATVKDTSGVAVSGVTLSIQGQNLVTDATGSVAVALKEGSYSFTLKIPDGYLASTTSYAVTAKKTSVEIQIIPKMKYETNVIYIGGDEVEAYIIGTGTSEITMLPDTTTYFLFTPPKSGYYKITTDNSAVKLSDWSTTVFPFPHSSNKKSLTQNVKPSQFSDGTFGMGAFVIGVTGASHCNLTITRTGAAKLDASDVAWTVYEGTHTPKAFSLTIGAGQSLKYVDITASTSAYTPVLNTTDGFYHLGSADGPLLYLDFDNKYLSFLDFLDNGTGIRRYFYDSNGDFQWKEDYTKCMKAYAKCIDTKKNVYPLTEDLVYIIQQYGDSAGWWDKNTTDGFYLFEGESGVNAKIAWMFAICYLE